MEIGKVDDGIGSGKKPLCHGPLLEQIKRETDSNQSLCCRMLLRHDANCQEAGVWTTLPLDKQLIDPLHEALDHEGHGCHVVIRLVKNNGSFLRTLKNNGSFLRTLITGISKEGQGIKFQTLSWMHRWV